MNSIAVEILGREPEPVATWNRYVSTHPAGTIYHLSAWRTIFEKSFNYRSWLLMARDRISCDLIGALPLYLVPTPFVRRLVSVPFRDRGGVLWNSPEAFCALIDRAKEIMSAVNAVAIELKSLAGYPAELVARENLVEQHYWIRSASDLRGANTETIWRNIGDKRKNIRRAREQNLTFVDITQDPAAPAIWYELHLDTQKRLGLPPFPRQFFSCLLEELRPGERIKLFAVKDQGLYLAASIVLLDRRIAIYAYGASSRSAQLSRPNDFLFFNMMRWSAENGYECFDMGSDSPQQENLLAFKSKWLASQECVPRYGFGNAAASIADSSATRYALLRAVFRRLPRSLLRGIGTNVTRYFG
jgi:hypothetical protein